MGKKFDRASTLKPDSLSQTRARRKAKRARVDESGLTSRARGHVSARVKRDGLFVNRGDYEGYFRHALRAPPPS